MTRSTQEAINTEENEHLLMSPYTGKVGETTLKSLRNDLNCDETYIGEIGRRFSERIMDLCGRDDKLHLYVHAEKTGHENVNIDHFEILPNGYKNNRFKRKLAEALHVKHERPTLNIQAQSVPLKLFS